MAAITGTAVKVAANVTVIIGRGRAELLTGTKDLQDRPEFF
jgi:hypothetical protein